MGNIKSFEDLDVFKRSYKISIEIHKVSLKFPKIEQWSLADQIRRASKGICSNIAEGFGKQKYSSAEYRRYLIMAMGSCDEIRVWIRYCFDLGYISSEQWNLWRNEYEELSKMLVGLQKFWHQT